VPQENVEFLTKAKISVPFLLLRTVSQYRLPLIRSNYFEVRVGICHRHIFPLEIDLEICPQMPKHNMAKDFICVLLMAIVAAFPLLFSVKYVTMKVVELQGPAGLDTLYNVYLPLHLSLLAATPASAARALLVGFDDVADVTETDRKYYIVVVLPCWSALTMWQM
jgi:hypothetical protein